MLLIKGVAMLLIISVVIATITPDKELQYVLNNNREF